MSVGIELSFYYSGIDFIIPVINCQVAFKLDYSSEGSKNKASA